MVGKGKIINSVDLILNYSTSYSNSF